MYAKILVINMLHIGDLLLATPALSTLRANYPQAHIALMADAKLADLVKYNRHIDELIAVDKKGYHDKLPNMLRLIGGIRRRRFDLVINLHPNERASAIAAFSGAKKIVGYASRGFGMFFDYLGHNQNFDDRLRHRPDIPHQAQEHLNLLRDALGITRIDDRGLEMWLDEEMEKQADALWREAFAAEDRPVVGFNTGASWPTKRWTTDGFADVADALLDEGYRVAFFGGPMDEENVCEIRARMRHDGRGGVAVFTGKVSLGQLAALLKKCAVFLTNDSGPMHVAVAQKVPVVAIFGPSNEVGFGPYTPPAVVVKHDLPCRPCERHQCRRGDHACMACIAPDQVLREVRAMLAEAGAENDRK